MTLPQFPSGAHEKRLKEKLSELGWVTMSTDEKMQWHSYVYARRQVFLHLSPESPPPTDPRKEWYFPRQVDEVMAGYKRGQLWRKERAPERITPAMQAYQRGDYTEAERLDNQDRARRNFKGPDEEYVALCVRQVRENTSRFVFNTRTYK